ncbi:MAG: efflux RND transporter periplasmic adaptor subunit [Phycisphaeraceae bacterium]|nr:efflux RND transporter periplasmic adaptor subunit [Phycisphaeraceae bacterium]
MKRWSGVVVVVGLMLLAGCDRSSQAGSGPAAAPAAPVTVAVALRQDVPVRLTAIGSVRPRASVTLKPQVGGVITAIHFQPGQGVAAGDLLVSIDARPYQAALHQAQAAMAQNQAMAANARTDAKRVEELAQQGAAVPYEVDQKRYAAEALEAAVAANQAAIEQAKLELDYCTLRSPIAGRIGDKLVDVGNVVKADETELVVINQVRPIDVAFSLPESELARVRKFMAQGPLTVRVTLPGDGETALVGQTTFIDNQVDPSTGMIRLKASFENEGMTLWPGQFVNVSVELTVLRGVVTTPGAALLTSQEGTIVYVVGADQTARAVKVEPGYRDGATVVIDEGLEAGATIVTDGQLRLVDGARVAVKGAAAGAEHQEDSRP